MRLSLGRAVICTSILWGALAANAQSNLLSMLKFTATEYLIYTDQLQKFDATECSQTLVSPYSVEQAKAEILAKLKPEDQAEFRELFESPQVQMLLEENSKGISSVLGAQSLTSAPSALSADRKAACQEFSLAFQTNLTSTRSDLEQLLESYRAN